MLTTDLLHSLRRGLFVVAMGALTLFHSPIEAADAPGRYDPVADPRAVVTTGHARFTILTPQLIRMEWAADGKFEDHASLVFLNRHLPVPDFTQQLSNGGKTLTIKTGPLTLTYTPAGDGHFTANDLSITLIVDLKQVTWHPGQID